MCLRGFLWGKEEFLPLPGIEWRFLGLPTMTSSCRALAIAVRVDILRIVNRLGQLNVLTKTISFVVVVLILLST